MPTYDFKCPVCKNYIEIMRSIHDNSKVYCKKCEEGHNKKVEMDQILTPVDFVITGYSYKTGYSSK